MTSAGRTLILAFVESGVVTDDRITEATDDRITEASDDRIISATKNTIDTSLVAIPTFTGFISVAYYKEGGTWKVFEPYVKQDGVWTTNFLIYKKVSGTWTRGY